MKSLPWKKLAIVAGAIAVVIAAVFYLNPLKTTEEQPVSFIDPAFGEYISSYTAGTISSGSPITIMLSQDVIDSTEVGQESAGKLFDFNPGIAGKAIWLDKRTVEFRPEKRLTSGQIYEVNFLLSRLMPTLPSNLKTFTYTVQVIPQNFDVSIENVKPYVNTELKRQKIEGIFITADFAENEAVEKTVTAAQEGKSLAVSWTHASDGKQHGFIVEDVSRKEDSSLVSLNFRGGSLGVEKVEDQNVTIPSLSDFKLMNTKVVQNPNQHVILQFSDPIKENQNLEGLITIEEVESVDFDIHDNEIWVYPPVRQNGVKTISIQAGIRNILDYKMKNPFTAVVLFEQSKPAVRFTGKGSILPSTDGMVLPFEAVNLNAVDVQVIKIFETNVLQFLQVNNIDGSSEMRRVGKKIINKTIRLDNTGITDPGKWNRYTLDISSLVNTEPGAIYQVKLSFKKSHSAYSCEGEVSGEESESQFDSNDSYDYEYEGYDGEYYEDYYYYDDYDWEERDNPCNTSYYTRNRAITKNIFASDLGLSGKRGDDGNTYVFITDLKTAAPLAGVQVELYDFQQQLMGTATSGSDGKVVINTKEDPFVAIAKNENQRGYLRLTNGDALPLSNFDVSGEVIQKGLKGFLYGERGVWRPGDSLYLTFILEDKNKILPAAHPVVFELSNPQGQVVNRLVRATAENGFYKFATATDPDAPTGNWTGRVKVGGTEFSQSLKIETVKPNRLKINMDFGAEKITSPDISGNLEVKWLHGAPGRNLKAEFDVILVTTPTTFKKFETYTFEDPSRQFSSESQVVFDGNTDGEGKAIVNATLATSNAAPGFLNAIFRGKVYEESGNFSTDRFTIPYYPYESFVGLKMPEGERYSGVLYTDSTHRVDLVTLDNQGKPLARNLELNIYKLNWRWWWDHSGENLANYVEGSYSKLIKTETTSTGKNGKGTWSFELKAAEYGRYFMRVCDPVSGHCTGSIFYVDQPGWWSRSRGDEEGKGAATMLSFATDKTQYNIGEKINLTVPSSGNGRMLVSVENGSKVLQTYWVETQQGETRFSFEAIPEMAPNVYVNVSLLQQHAQTTNDLPIRLFGVVPVRVEDPNTHLEPVISMPEVLEPGEEVVIRVSEKTNRKMTYTVAMVDDGLLDLTRFKTPDAWTRFYAREALGVRSWDLYDHVIGAFGADLERKIAIGGDAGISPKDEDPRANRFKPAVKFFGPYTLESGSEEIRFIMPQYIGSVRTMVVAGYEGAYGKTEKTTPVRKPLMVLATLPRVLGPDESLKLPITLFTQEKSISNVKVDVKVSGPVAITGGASKTVSMNATGDLTVNFDLNVKNEVGIAKVEVTASSGKFKATDVIEIEVRNPNLPVTKVTEALLEANKSWSTEIVPLGISGTNSAVLEISNMPPINLGSRLRYLIQYPHGCIEQTTSAVFPQLYLDQVKVLSETEQVNVQRNIKVAIEKLKSFAQADGGFAYWPGAENSDSWGTNYAGHFLIEAEAKGYYVPAEIIKRWKKYQRNKAVEWVRPDNNYYYYNTELIQAYRLYTLAVAGAPELGAMNRLREMSNLNTTSVWMLAAAYAKAGQIEAAKQLISKLSTIVKPYRELHYTYGSDLRDQALILETLVLVKEREKAFEVLKLVSQALSNNGYWMSTQEVAFCLKAISSFAGMDKRGELKVTYSLGSGKVVTSSSELPITQIQIPITGVKKESVKVQSESKGTLFIRLITEGTPARGEEEDASSNLTLDIRYTDTDGGTINPTQLEQGTEFIAEVTVAHTGIRNTYENLALSQVFPSGWEINNLRLEGTEAFLKSGVFNYQDIRDDRVFTYFMLSPGERRTFRVMLTATYAGNYYLPAVSCEAMYDKSIYARRKGQPVEVIKTPAQ